MDSKATRSLLDDGGRVKLVGLWLGGCRLPAALDAFPGDLGTKFAVVGVVAFTYPGTFFAHPSTGLGMQ